MVTAKYDKVEMNLKKPEFFDYDKYLSAKPSKIKFQMALKDEDRSSDNSPIRQGADEAAEAASQVLDIEAADKENTAEKRVRIPKSNRKKAEKTSTAESIMSALDSALDEDIAEIAEFSVTKNIDDEPTIKKTGFKRNLYFIVGIAVSFMSLIGFLSCVVFFAGFITNIADNTKQKEKFAEVIYPIVIVDPAACEKTSQLPSDTVISAAIWDIILYGDISKYSEEFGMMTIPQLDIELHATSLFGSGLTFEHKTLGDASLSFYYDEVTQSYNVPASPKFFPYSPRVESIKRDGDIYKLRVGYVSPSPAWLMNKNAEVEPDKYMEYVLTKNNNDYTLTAINKVSDPEKVDKGL